MTIHVGEALIDFVPQVGVAVTGSTEGPAEGGAVAATTYLPVPGGSPYNCAIAAARLGAESRFLCRIATDFFGDRIVARLAANGVGLEYVVRSDQPTTLAFVERQPDGGARYAFFVNGAADRALVATDLPAELPAGAILQFGSISLIGEPAGSTIIDLVEREAGRRIVSFDPNIRTSVITDVDAYRARCDRAIAAATIVKVSDEDLAWLVPGVDLEAAAVDLLTRGPTLVVVTRGAEGAFAVLRPGNLRSVAVPAVKTTVSDTIGAGDSFHAALLTWLDENGVSHAEEIDALSDGQIEAMLTFAVRVAAVTCSRPGADPPHRAELD